MSFSTTRRLFFKKEDIGEISQKKREEKYDERTYESLSTLSATRQLTGRMPPAGSRGESLPEALDREVTVSQLVNFDKLKMREHRSSRLVRREAHMFVWAMRSVVAGKSSNTGYAGQIGFGQALSDVFTLKASTALDSLENSVSLHDYPFPRYQLRGSLSGVCPRRV